MIKIIKIRKKLKINQRNLSRTNSNESRRNRLAFIHVNYSLFAIRVDNNENDDELRDNLQFHIADENQRIESSKKNQRVVKFENFE
jgi:hypothetical protein